MSGPNRRRVLVLHAAGLDGDCARFIDVPGVVAPTLVPKQLTDEQRLSLATVAEQIADSLTEPVHVVGLSMGGMVAQHLALLVPDHVLSLVLACTTSNPDRETMVDRARFTLSATQEEVVHDTLARWFSEAGRAENGDGVRYARACLETCPRNTLADIWLAIGDHDLDASMADIRVPTTCLAGATDVATPLAEMERVCALVPNARLDVIDGPHMALLESPTEFSAHIRDHLAWASARSR